MSRPEVKKGGSLLERAAEVYDFQAHLRAREVPDVVEEAAEAGPEPLDPVSPEPVEERFSGDEAELVGCHVPGVDPSPSVSHHGEMNGDGAASRKVAIDRALMADNHLLIPSAPVGVLAEEFRLVKRQLLLTMRSLMQGDPEKARTILVCSPKPGDGKTYCAINLAISLAAERDTSVLLVDADFAKPDVMTRLGVESDGPGFLEVLADPGLGIEDCVIATDIPQLSLLPAGRRTNADTELVASERTAELIAELLDADPHRIVVFDSPPALAASPAAVLALHVGQVMLVVRADRTTETDIRDTVQRLDGCEEIQLLLNGVAFSADGYRFGNYYGSGR